ncbi:MAG: DUF302 domain-containing protein [Desulfovibrionales bacterium]
MFKFRGAPILGWVLGLSLLALPVFGAGPGGDVTGLVTLKSNQSMEQTVEALKKAIQDKGLTLFTTIDHAANARNAGLQLPPTKVVVFGNPTLGTPLMQAQQTIGVDLPQKMLVWENGEGQVWIAYNDPEYLARRHGVSGKEEIFTKIAGALDGLARAAAGHQ